MLWCRQPHTVYEKGVAAYSHHTNRVPRGQVACGRCDACVKNRKQDWAGKLLAEYQTAGSAFFVTLTYKEKPQEFRYADVQEMLKRLRIFLFRKRRKMSARFLCVGERGDKFGRRHWHLILFISGNVYGDPAFISSEAETPGELWKFWPHGWTDIKPLCERSEAAGRIRYCVKYAVKDVGQKGERLRMSLKPALGHEWLMRHARDVAEAHLAPNGRYQIPGCVWKQGHKRGQLESFTLRGVNRRSYIGAWRHAWERFWGTEPPTNDWLRQFDEYACSVVFDPTRKANRHFFVNGPGVVRPGRITVRQPGPVLDGPQASVSRRWIVGVDWACELCVTVGGFFPGDAWVEDGDKSYPVVESISEVLDLPSANVSSIDKWLKGVRPWDYKPGMYDGQKAAEAAEERERRSALSAFYRRHCAATVARQSAKHGVAAVRAFDVGAARPSRAGGYAAEARAESPLGPDARGLSAAAPKAGAGKGSAR